MKASMVYFFKKHKTIIKTSITVIGLVTTTILAVKRTPKVKELLAEQEKEKGEPLTKKEVLCTSIKGYAPAIAVGSLTIAHIIYGASREIKDRVATTAVINMLEKTHENYKKEVVKELGEEKESEITSRSVIKNVPKKNNKNTVVVNKLDDLTLMYDPLSGRYFYSNRELTDAAINTINSSLNSGEWVPLNWFYDAIGIPNCELGELIGWDNRFDGQVRISYGAILSENDEPSMSIIWHTIPGYYGNDFVH